MFEWNVLIFLWIFLAGFCWTLGGIVAGRLMSFKRGE